jgi:hypothetical protein
VNVETKEQSKQWMHIHSPNKPKMFEQMSACGKMMTTVFWDRKRELMVELMQQGTTITSEMYCETLKKLSRAIRNKMRGMLTSGVMLLHDNARPHTVPCTRAPLEHLNWEVSDHPPYSPDLAPSDYHLFTYLKNWLQSQRLNDNEFMEGVKTWLGSQAANFFDTGVHRLVPWYKCLSSGSDYIEK